MFKMRCKPLIPIVAVSIGLLAWSQPAQSISKEELEAQAARDFAEQKEMYPLVTDQAVIDYVSCVANAVVAVMEPPHDTLNWEMAIFDTDMVNAMAAPGGKISVFAGIFKTARNQDQLAAVIGHELAHVTEEHSLTYYNKMTRSAVGIRVLSVLVGAGVYGASYTAEVAMHEGLRLRSFSYGRGHETEADVVGLQYMAKAGFDPRSAVPLWQNMAAYEEEASGGASRPDYLRTHPPPENRIDELISQWTTALPLYNEAIAEDRIPNCGPSPVDYTPEEE